MTDIKSLEEMTVKELQAYAEEKGVQGAAVFTTKAQLIQVISMQGTGKPMQTDGDAKPVATLNPPVSPKQDKKDEQKWRTKREHMRDILANQPKVRILVPLEGKERQGVVRDVYNEKTKRTEQKHISGAVQPVTLNGWVTLVPKGIYVEVPQQVADVIQDKFKQTSEAGANLRIDRLDPETGRPVSEQLT